MSKTTTVIKKYSAAFKMKVVSEIEQGKFSIDKARKFYDIGGSQTGLFIWATCSPVFLSDGEVHPYHARET